jgi:hypothetical protein
MARSDTQRAIGAVTRLLRDHLIRRGFAVSVGKPEQAAQNDAVAKLNLFLYETVFDPSLRNQRLDEDGPEPLWFVLRYLVTAFDDEEQSDSTDAHELLGRGIVALHELNFLRLDSATDMAVRQALEHNPEPLKITFEESNPDLLSKLMQGADETFRLSAAFQVRPVMLLPAEPPRSQLLVGIDYSTDPAAEVGEDAIGVQVIPSLGARLDAVSPRSFDPGETITLYGTDLHLAGLEALIGVEPIRVTGQWPDRMTVEIEATAPGPGGQGRIAQGLGPSAGERPISLRQLAKNGRYRSSNLIPGRLRPVVSAVGMNGAALELAGQLLGAAEDDVVVALYADGAVVAAFDVVTTQANQLALTVPGVGGTAAPGGYLVIVRVNGVQARRAPPVVIP